jgi:hypothetical protein
MIISILINCVNDNVVDVRPEAETKFCLQQAIRSGFCPEDPHLSWNKILSPIWSLTMGPWLRNVIVNNLGK